MTSWEITRMEKLSVNGTEYEIKKLLGKGKGGYSYLAEKDGKQYVVKQIHHEPCSYYQFGNKIQSEIDDYKRLSAIGIKMPAMLEVDVDNERIANTNIDYFPTNFVVNNGEIFYIDYECNDYMEEWNFENWGIKYWSKTPDFLKYVEEHS